MDVNEVFVFLENISAVIFVGVFSFIVPFVWFVQKKNLKKKYGDKISDIEYLRNSQYKGSVSVFRGVDPLLFVEITLAMYTGVFFFLISLASKMPDLFEMFKINADDYAAYSGTLTSLLIAIVVVFFGFRKPHSMFSNKNIMDKMRITDWYGHLMISFFVLLLTSSISDYDRNNSKVVMGNEYYTAIALAVLYACFIPTEKNTGNHTANIRSDFLPPRAFQARSACCQFFDT